MEGRDFHAPLGQWAVPLACQLLRMFTVVQRPLRDAATIRIMRVQQQQQQQQQSPQWAPQRQRTKHFWEVMSSLIGRSCLHRLRWTSAVYQITAKKKKTQNISSERKSCELAPCSRTFFSKYSKMGIKRRLWKHEVVVILMKYKPPQNSLLYMSIFPPFLTSSWSFLTSPHLHPRPNPPRPPPLHVPPALYALIGYWFSICARSGLYFHCSLMILDVY